MIWNLNFYLTLALRQRNADKIVEKQLNDSLEIIDNQGFKNAKYHYLKYKIHTENYEYLNNKKRNVGDSLQEQSEELDFFYISESLRSACIMSAQQTISKQTYSQPLLSAINDRIIQLKYLPISISAYFHALKTLIEPENAIHFHSLKEIIVANGLSFRKKSAVISVFIATNYCIRRLNMGDKIFGREALELYRARMSNHILLENGLLPIFSYVNILKLALKVDEYDWAENFY